LCINWLSPYSGSPSFIKKHPKPYPYAGKYVGKGSLIAVLPTNEGYRYATY